MGAGDGNGEWQGRAIGFLKGPADVGIDGVRCVTRFEHHSTTDKVGLHPAALPQIHTYDERL